MKSWIPLLLMISISSDGPAQISPQSWDSLVDRFFEQAEFRFKPSSGTSAGFHQYDTRLEDFSRDSIQQQIQVFRQYEREVQVFPGAKLTPEQAADRDIVLGEIRTSLLDLESIRIWETNPDRYSSTATNAIFLIMSRNFASQDERLRSVIARERQMPKMFASARVNLKNPPRIF